MKALFVLPDPEQPGLTEPERVALRVRNAATVTGQCACGNEMGREEPLTSTDGLAPFAHEVDCPAVAPLLERLAKRLGARCQWIMITIDDERPA